MVQMRLMGDDPERVRQVSQIVMDALRDSGLLFVGDPGEVDNRRGPGLRIFTEVAPFDQPRPTLRVDAERVDERRPGRARAALPPGPRRALRRDGT